MNSENPKNREHSKKLFPDWLAWIGTVVALGFIVNVVVENRSHLAVLEIHCEIFPLILACGLLALALFCSCAAWFVILRSLNIDTSWRLAQHNWFLSNLGKYIPGKIWTATGRAYLHSTQNHSAATIIIATGFEAMISLAAAVFITLALMVYLDQITEHFGLLILLFGVLFLFISPKQFNWFVNIGLKWIRKEPLTDEIGLPERFKIFFLAIAAFSLRGAGFFFFVKSLFPSAPENWLFFFYASIFSNLLGLLAFFAPKGLGVREGSLILILGPVVTEAAAIAISIVSRFWLVIIELVLIIGVHLFCKPRLKK